MTLDYGDGSSEMVTAEQSTKLLPASLRQSLVNISPQEYNYLGNIPK